MTERAEAIRALADRFLEERSGDIDVLFSSLTERRFDRIVSVSHRITGTAAAFGFKALSRAGHRVHAAALSKDEVRTRLSLHALQIAWQRAKAHR